MESLVKHYIQEAKEGIEIDGEIVKLLNKKESETVLKKYGITNQMFGQLIKTVMDCYSKEFANHKAGSLINNDEIKAKFPEAKYIQDITVRSYLCHALETSKNVFDSAISEDESIKKEAIKDLTLNLAVVQLKKIYKITSLKFAKILNKEKEAITASEVKNAKTELERQIKLDTGDIIPDNIKNIIIDKGEKITNQSIVNIAKEIKKIDVVIDTTAIANVNKYLTAIKNTFEFLIKIKGINIKNLKESEKTLEKIFNYKEQEVKTSDSPIVSKKKKNENETFLNLKTQCNEEIKKILKTLGNINSYALKENFEHMNLLAWCYNVLNLKAYHTNSSCFDDVTTEFEKKVVSILNRYKPAQRNSYDASHLVEDFIELCRDEAGEIKLSHQISDLMLIEVLKDFMKKTNDQVNMLSRVSNKINKVGIVDVTRDESGNVTQINNDKTEKQRRSEVEKMISNQFETVAKARKFFLDIYNNLATFNGKSWNSLSQDVQNALLKAAKIDRSSGEYLDIKLNRRIEKNTGINPYVRETEVTTTGIKKELDSTFSSFIKNDNAKQFIKKMMNLNAKQIESLKNIYGVSRFTQLKDVIQQYKEKGIIKEKLKDVFDKPNTDTYKFSHKLADFDRAFRLMSPNGSTRNLFIDSVETPILNKYLGLINENK